ncbi:hypothetical protein PMO31116_00421 [Pandoraea morbifera]|uniref:DUF4936 domain-containing protein n=1 Tax=Pandoraea morbifera TaxID=2508300 RepID=A0A5E4S016_9BURK|nr:DUF4936 family protein [Pandoraea morbifera]VVD67439.1 hypothetical protein PMO31116_00421 [Pandoraea morbifera]
MDCYVYYRVSTHDAAPARLAAAHLLALAAARFGVRGRLQWRVGAPESHAATLCTTWMERYDQVDDAFVAALPSLVAESGLATLVQGERHVECFVDATDAPPPCA